jgi:ribosome-associated protein
MEDDIPLSKTRRKQEMHSLQDIGEALVALGNDRLAQLDIPDSLRDAVVEAKRLNARGALRRQLQYIGRLMRDIDPEPIKAKLDAWSGVSKAETTKLHLIERWRERLLAEENALGELLQDHPLADRQHLRNLIRNAQHELKAGKAPKSSRTLFRELRELLGTEEEAGESEEHGLPDADQQETGVKP